MADDIPKKVLEKDIIKSLLKVAIFNKPMKNKFIWAKLSPEKLDFPSIQIFGQFLDQMRTVFQEMMKSDPKSYEGTEVLVTHDVVSLKSYDADKFKGRMSIFTIGNDTFKPGEEEFQMIKTQIQESLKSLKIPIQRVLIVPYPVSIMKGPEDGAK